MLRHLDTNQCYYSVGSLFNIFLRLTIFFFVCFFFEMEDTINGFDIQNNNRYWPGYGAGMCTQANLENLYLKLGMSNLQ